MTKRTKAKPAGFKAGLFFLSVFCFAMGALGVYGWTQAEMDIVTRAMTSFGAGATALVIPFTVIVIGRSWASAGVLPVLALCMAMQAVSFHNFYGVVIEAPHKRAFETGLQSLSAEVSRTTGIVDKAQAAVDAIPALALPACRCPETKKSDTAAWEANRKPLDAALTTAKADRQTAIKALEAAQANYKPMAPDLWIWIVGGLLDISIAMAIWSLEATGRKLRKDAVVQRAKAKKPRRKTVTKAPLKGFKPYVAVSNT